MKEKTTTIEKTDFKGPVSLDAIFAATSKKPEGAKDVKITSPSPLPEIKAEVPAEGLTPPAKTNTEAPKAVDPFKTTTPEPLASKETESYKTAKRLIGLGLLEDFSIQVSDEDEGTAISAFTSMTEENLKEIIKIHKKEKEDSISSNFIPKEGLKEHQIKVIEILKNGGDLSEIAATKEKAFERPFEGYDLENQQRQVDVLYTDLTKGKGLDHDSAVVLIDKEARSGTLQDTATKVFDKYRKAHSEYIDRKLAEKRKEKEFKDLNFKENKKALTAKFKEAGLKEAAYKKVTAEYAKKDSKGEYVLVEKLRQALDNPEKNHELILHLSDKSLFNTLYKINASQDKVKTIVRLATGAATKSNRAGHKTTGTGGEAPWLKFAESHNSSLKN